jgi:hypothetical protein
MDSTGGVVAQPVLGRAADVWGYPGSYLLSAGISALALPFYARARREKAPADTEVQVATPVPPDAEPVATPESVAP